MLTFWILCEIYFTFNTVHVEEQKYDLSRAASAARKMRKIIGFW